MQEIGTLWKLALRNLDRPELVRPSTFAWSLSIALMVGIVLERGGVDPRPSSVPPTIVPVPVLEDESVASARKLLGEVESAIDVHRALTQWEVGTQTWCAPGFAAVLDCGDDRECMRITTMAHYEQGPVACNDSGGCIRCDEAVGPAALACREVWRPDPLVRACKSMMQREYWPDGHVVERLPKHAE